MKWYLAADYSVDRDTNYVMKRAFARELILQGMFDDYTAKKKIDRKEILNRTKLNKLYRRTKCDYLFREHIVPILHDCPSFDKMLQMVDYVYNAASLRKYMKAAGFYDAWKGARNEQMIPCIEKGISVNAIAKHCGCDTKTVRSFIISNGWLQEYRSVRRKNNWKVYF